MDKHTEEACGKYDSERDISGRAGGSYGHYLADVLMFDKEVELLEKESELEKKLEFVKRVDSLGINPDDLFSHRMEKEKLIQEYKGYTRLNVSGQKQNENGKSRGESISDCSDHKIGLVFKSIYYSVLKKLKK